jgi:hypothetical protein
VATAQGIQEAVSNYSDFDAPNCCFVRQTGIKKC